MSLCRMEQSYTKSAQNYTTSPQTSKPPRTRIISNGLDLHNVKYRLAVEHKFKLDCSDLDNGPLKVTVSPSSAATVDITNPLKDKPHYYQCRILPLEIGSHEVAVTHSGNHIYGSPFTVQFGYPGDASKCSLSTNTTLHRVGNRVSLTVSTQGAGFGHLQAGVQDLTKNKPMRLLVTRAHPEAYTLEFDPGYSSECILAVKYDNAHITGSPFRLLFSELASCIAEGPGLVSGQVGAWNTFSVKGKENSLGALKVNVNTAQGERVETVVSSRSSLHFDVSYYPKVAGYYTITLHWGDARVPGSPFRIPCHPSSLVIVDRPSSDVTLGSSIEFKVQPLGSWTGEKNADMSVSARDSTGEETIGHTTWQPDKQCFMCTLMPRRAGKYPISVRFNDAHIIGSPFVITVINPPDADRVKVWGTGLVGTTVDSKGEFCVDVSKAGTGLLSVGVQGQQDLFKINTSRNSSSGLITVSYSSSLTGMYLMDVTWSGQHVPLSPFTIIVNSNKLKKGKDDEKKHKMFLENVTSVGINGDWLNVWHSSNRLKRNCRSSPTIDRLGHEEALTFL